MSLGRRQVIGGGAALALLGAARSAAAATPLAQVPFTLLNGKMFVDVQVNGQPAAALVDSGADRSGLDTGYAKRTGIRLGLPSIQRGIQGFQTARTASGVKLTIGGVDITGSATVIDYSGLAGRVRHDIEAVVGGDVFHTYVVQLDFDTQLLLLHDRTSFQPPAGAQIVPLTLKGGLITAPVAIEGHAPIQAIVDLGNNAALIVSPGPAQKLGLLTGRKLSTARLGGHGPASIAQAATAAQITLGGQVFHQVPLLIPPHSIGFDANLGLPVLSRFTLYLDFGGQRMWLGAPSSDRDDPFQRDRTGLEADIDGDRLKVALVAKGSPAEAGGWRAGDIITQINGQPAVEANLALSLSATPGQSVTFTLASGAIRTLVLADYY